MDGEAVVRYVEARAVEAPAAPNGYYPAGVDAVFVTVTVVPRRFDFGEAIRLLKLGQMVTRPGYRAQGLYLEMQVPDAHSKMTLPYIFLGSKQGDRVPWTVCHSDILSEDWEFMAW